MTSEANLKSEVDLRGGAAVPRKTTVGHRESLSSAHLMLVLLMFAVATMTPDPAAPMPRVMTRSSKRSNRTRVATLNCRTLKDDVTLADLDITLTKNNVTLCSLQEVRRQGCMSTKSENYKIYWYGEHSDRGGVGFAIKKQFVHLVKDVKGVPDSDGRIITMDILLHDPKHPVTVVGAYSPTNTSSKQTREKFYNRLRDIVTPSVWLLGDFNARVGRRTPDQNSGVQPSITVGPCSLKGDIVPNENGALLLDIASDFNLRHVGSHFSCRDSKRWTWRHPRYGTCAVLDHMYLPKPQSICLPPTSGSCYHSLYRPPTYHI